MARVLIVLDGTYRFAEPAATRDFTYIALVEALEAAGHQVTKANRDTNGVDATADIGSFNFATSVDLLDFDVLWLIGFEGRNVSGTSGTHNLQPAELAALGRYMAAGGGVFATGDHDSIGADMCGSIPRVRAMRAWYGSGDAVSPMLAAFPRNFPPLSAGRADTTRKNPLGDYDRDDDMVDEAFVWFENQSDKIPQPIAPTSSPAHPILRRGGSDILVYPDHMHEGQTLGEVVGYDYTQTLTFDGESFPEFPAIAGHRELPSVIATGQTVELASRMADFDSVLDAAIASLKTVNTLSVYDGRVAGVGRIVTGSTFHHYVDINLTGDTDINTDERRDRTGPDAEKGHGFNDAPSTFADIKAVFANITAWLARPRPALHLILERSTFSQDEATATPDFNGAILVTVDGLKPSQFPGGGITTLAPAGFQPGWAPTVVPANPTGFVITPTRVDSDDPALPDRLQRFTFTYRVSLAAPAFGFPPPDFRHIEVDATLSSFALADPLTDSAWVTLVKAANPFMLDLAGGNTTSWLSSDVRVFPVVAGQGGLVADATRAQAIAYIHSRVSAMTVAEFEALPHTQPGSALSSLPTTTGSGENVYNFAVARVRLNGTAAVANGVRVFFRMFTSQTTAALTYLESMGEPIEGYKQTSGAAPIALPGTNGAGTEWLSFPFFRRAREATPAMQTDPDNVEDITPTGSEVSTFFGALLDNNLSGAYLPLTPMGVGAVPLPDLLMGEHQCLVAQIEYAGAPIAPGARPNTSDKLAQRNIAMSTIANPGVDGSRTALHTFEIEATPHPVSEDFLPDELLLDWPDEVPDGTRVRLFISSWNAGEVVELADRFYPRHEIRAVDARTVSLPGGGMRYVPIPRSLQRQTGVIMADFPPGVKRGQRFDLSVRQVTSRRRQVDVVPARTIVISREEAARLIEDLEGPAAATHAVPPRGVFEIGGNRTLVTDLSVLDDSGNHAVIIEQPTPEEVAAQRRETRSWRETIGAFQLGIPVAAKGDMLGHHLRLLSVLRWRAQWLRPNGRWYDSFHLYVDLIAEKVRALGGDPYSVPATPDGAVPLPGGDGGDGDGTAPDFWRRHCPMWLAVLILILLLILLFLLLTR